MPTSFPRYLVVGGAFLTLLVGYVGARGPENVVQELQEAFGKIEPPNIVLFQPTRKDPLTFVVSIENRSLRQIQITAYVAEPVVNAGGWTDASSGPLPIVDADEVPANCASNRRVVLSRPLVIDPGSSGGLSLKPWTEKCDFRLSVEGTSGISAKVAWTPELNAKLCMPGQLLNYPGIR